MPVIAEHEYEELFRNEYEAIPERMREGLINYVVKRIQPGGFLTAVICNDLRTAVNTADDKNYPLLRLYVMWFHNVAPMLCYGSREAMRLWLDTHEKP